MLPHQEAGAVVMQIAPIKVCSSKILCLEQQTLRAQTADLWLRSACSRAVAISLSIVSCCAAFSAAMRSSCVCFW